MQTQRRRKTTRLRAVSYTHLTLICYCGLRGIERASKAMMPLLFVLLIVVIVRSVTLPALWRD